MAPTDTQAARVTCRRDRWHSALAGPVAAVVALSTLAGCGTFSGRGATAVEARRTETTGAGRTPGAGAQKRGGGYYLDDGPGHDPPPNLEQIADAVPRVEPLHRGTARPYTVMGRSYTPMTSLAPYRARGIATWYGRRYHGQQTASGETYDMYAMTAAHTVLPIPSYARVTNLNNGRSVVVRVNDRGPFHSERLIDLSYTAAYKLDILTAGSALVEVESILPGATDASWSTAARPSSLERVPAVDRTAVIDRNPAAWSNHPNPQSGPAAIYVQLAAFSVRENAERFVERIRPQLDGLASMLGILSADALHRVRAGPFSSRADAEQAALQIEQRLGDIPIIAAPR